MFAEPRSVKLQVILKAVSCNVHKIPLKLTAVGMGGFESVSSGMLMLTARRKGSREPELGTWVHFYLIRSSVALSLALPPLPSS